MIRLTSQTNKSQDHQTKKDEKEIFISEVKLCIMFFMGCTGAHRQLCKLLYWFERQRKSQASKILWISPTKKWIASKLKSSRKTVQRFNKEANGLITIHPRFLKRRQMANQYVIPLPFFAAMKFLQNYTNWQFRHLSASDLVKIYERRHKALYMWKTLPKNVRNVPPKVPGKPLVSLYTPFFFCGGNVHNLDSRSSDPPEKKGKVPWSHVHNSVWRDAAGLFTKDEVPPIVEIIRRKGLSEFRWRDIIRYMKWVQRKQEHIRNKINFFNKLGKDNHGKKQKSEVPSGAI